MPPSEERGEKAASAKNLDAGMDTSAPLVGCRGVHHRGREEGRCQRMEEVTGHGTKLGFCSKGSENIWKVLTEGRLALVYILKWSLWLPYGE